MKKIMSYSLIVMLVFQYAQYMQYLPDLHLFPVPEEVQAQGCDATFAGEVKYGSTVTITDSFTNSSSEPVMVYPNCPGGQGQGGLVAGGGSMQICNATMTVNTKGTFTVTYGARSCPLATPGENCTTHTECKNYKVIEENVCGDGIPDALNEGCDDGEAVNGKGQNGHGTIVHTSPEGRKWTCTATCGMKWLDDKYKCSTKGQSCVIDPTGTFATKEECENQCIIQTPSYICDGVNSGRCKTTTGPGFPTEEACLSSDSCKVLPKYKCSTKGQSCVIDPTGTFATKEECENQCIIQTPSYVCDGVNSGRCKTTNGPGFATEEACLSSDSCKVLPKYKCSTKGQSCVIDPTGTFTTKEECESQCIIKTPAFICDTANPGLCKETNGPGFPTEEACLASPTCKKNICGDGIPKNPNDEGIKEICDKGLDNGKVCMPAYGESCEYCQTTCEPKTITGPSCGDGNIDTPLEQCDGSNFPDGYKDGNYLCTEKTCKILCNDKKAVNYTKEGKCEYKANVCGDGDTLPTEDAECDAVNSTLPKGDCNPAYEQTCDYCDANCKKFTKKGPSCDGIKIDIPDEICDGENLPAGISKDEYRCEACKKLVCIDPKATPESRGTAKCLYVGCDGKKLDDTEECDGEFFRDPTKKETHSCDACQLKCKDPLAGNAGTLGICSYSCGDKKNNGDNPANTSNPKEICEPSLFTSTCPPDYSSTSPGKTCERCDTLCQIKKEVGPFCGDNDINGPVGKEQCDGTVLPGLDPERFLCKNCVLECKAGFITIKDANGVVIGCREPVLCPNGVLDTGETCDGTLFANGYTPSSDYSCNSCAAVCNNPQAINKGRAEVCKFPTNPCGNNTLDPTEDCDGKLFKNPAYQNNPDYMCSSCMVKCINPGNLNSDPRGACKLASCGNGIPETGEECDDGNKDNNDACNDNCKKQYQGCQDQKTCGWSKDATKASCKEMRDCMPKVTCGDGNKDPGEECDDKNLVSGDGCSSTCKLEHLACMPNLTCGYTSNASCSPCTTGADCKPKVICGDGKKEGDEECDDGNTTAGDGCTACKIDKPVSMCKNLDVKPTAGDLPMKIDLNCDGIGSKYELFLYNASGVVVSSRQTKTASYTILTGGEYRALCFVDGKSALAYPSTPGATTTTVFEDAVTSYYKQTKPGEAGKLISDILREKGINQVLPGFLKDITVTQYVEKPTPEMNRLVLELFTQSKLVANYIDQSCNNPCEKIIYAHQKASCGDGKVDVGEECDDGKLGTGNTCLLTCKKNICGDGLVLSGSEMCDDGNKNDVDSCSNACKLNGLCGNAKIDTGEVCDDGNILSGDACTPDCKTVGICGDAIIQKPNGSGFNEVCDNGLTGNNGTGLINGVICKPGCITNDGGGSGGGGSSGGGNNYCGDGVARNGEVCDDGNNKDGDGCDSNCKKEGGGSTGGGGGSLCGNGRKDPGEACDLGSENGKGICTTNCSVIGFRFPSTPASPTSDVPKCSFIDPPSIQAGEPLPFWRGYEKEADFMEGTCSTGNVGKIARGSLQCHFSVLGPQGDVIDTITTSCDSNKLGDAKRYNDFKNTVDSSTRSLLDMAQGGSIWNPSKKEFSSYGEYAIQLDRIDYETCTSLGMRKTNYDDRVCQYNFAVTTPYMIQKGVSLSSFQDDIDLLKRFSSFDGRQLLDMIGFSPVQTISSIDVASVLASLVDRYSKQATQTVVEATNFFQSYKKVPGQEIYVTDKHIVFEHSKNINGGKPTVLIAKGDVSVRVIGSLSANLMVIAPSGTVTFENTDCDTQDVVQGIFVAKSFASNTVKNTANSDRWCKGGGLVVEGMLVGGGSESLKQLRDARRSTLNDWFNLTTKRDTQIFDGASLRIQTNTKLWDNLPSLVGEVMSELKVKK